MDIDANVYRAVAKERVTEAQRLYELGAYGVAIYIAGVAVESMLRSLALRRGVGFPTNHNLEALRRTARFMDDLRGSSLDAATLAFANVVTRWSNLHRYRSTQAMRVFLKAGRFDRRIRGDFLKENSRIALVAATTLVTIGEQKWTK
jgi:HEPN domain-containing protein